MGEGHGPSGARLTPERAERGPSNLFLYLLGTGTWFAAQGVQTVLFSWLVIVQLGESPEKVGFAQAMLMVPTLFLLMVGGATADRFGGARIALLAQGAAMLPVAVLALLVATDALVYVLLVSYALSMGVVFAFQTPARDGLLSHIAGGRIQRMVVLASLVQFGVQIVGFQFAGLADLLGPTAVLLGQLSLLALGVLSFFTLDRRLGRQLPAPVGDAPRPTLRAAIGEGFSAVLSSDEMRPVVFVNALVGLFFMGAFQVGIPLLIREFHGGTPAQLAQSNTVHMVGVVLTTLWLLRAGDVERRGRALICGVVIGALSLMGIAASDSFAMLLVFNGCWGVTAGLVMAMARTIMQEASPPALRGRVMAFFSLSFMGVGPLGAYLSGLLVDGFGVRLALVVPAVAITICTLFVLLRTPLWRLAPHTAIP